MKKNLSFIFLVVTAILFTYFFLKFLIPLPVENKYIEIKIPKGATFREAVNIFSKEKLISNKTLFLLIGRISGLDRKIRAGYYSIYGSISQFGIFKILRKGQIIEYEIRILEGDSLAEIGEKLSQRGIITQEDFIRFSSDEDFLAFHDIHAPTLEGYLFPDTYKIPKGTDPDDVIGMMINKTREKYSDELHARTAELGLTERKVLTLASIIEKEAVVDEERCIISAVYHNRLRKGIPLQADPTAVYGIKNSSEKITASDLQRKTPYNTYVIKGLPPGPIASPGIKSIKAALYPADVPYIYFVSNNDGTHQFSVTAEEHLKAVKLYREKKQAENREREKQIIQEDERS